MSDDAATFESHRPALLALAYRMLGEMARAEDMVQDAWVRWSGRRVDVEAPSAFLLRTVARLCLDELGSARARHEQLRPDRLPEPVDLAPRGVARVEAMDQISMAFLVLLQRLTPGERAVFLLHEAFDMDHGEIAAALGRTAAACRQLLRRARANVASGRRDAAPSPEEHHRLLAAFVDAINGGAQAPLLGLLADDAVFIADAGPDGRYGQIRNVGRPVVGRAKIAALVAAIARQPPLPGVQIAYRVLNDERIAVASVEGRAVAAIFVSVADGRIHGAFLQGDPRRLGQL